MCTCMTKHHFFPTKHVSRTPTSNSQGVFLFFSINVIIIILLKQMMRYKRRKK